MLKLQSNKNFNLNEIHYIKLIYFEPKVLGLEKDKNSGLFIYTSK